MQDVYPVKAPMLAWRLANWPSPVFPHQKDSRTECAAERMIARGCRDLEVSRATTGISGLISSTRFSSHDRKPFRLDAACRFVLKQIVVNRDDAAAVALPFGQYIGVPAFARFCRLKLAEGSAGIQAVADELGTSRVTRPFSGFDRSAFYLLIFSFDLM